MKPQLRLLIASLAVLLVLVPGCGKAEDPPANTPYGSGGNGDTSGGGTSSGDASSGDASSGGRGAHAGAALDADLHQRGEAALAEARAKLLSMQDENGVFENLGYTALATSALIAATPDAQVSETPEILKALDYLVANQDENGAIADNPRYINYMTSASVGALAMARHTGASKYARAMAQGRDYLASSQIGGQEGDVAYGGFPYASETPQPPDLSNFQFALQALSDAGLPEDSEVWERARAYLKKVQNRSENGVGTFTVEIDGEPKTYRLGDDGGAGYGPGMSKAGDIKHDDGTFETKSYGSMTYALLKCLLLAGVDTDDPRVVAALGWIASHFTVDRNPGFEASADPEKDGQQGWYYYVYTMARTLAEYESETGQPLHVTDAQGNAHDWRGELVAELLERQRDDGTWVNEVAERWDEGSPLLATSYALHALADALGN